MFAAVKDIVYKVTELVGLEVKFQQDGSSSLSMVHLKKEKGQVEIVFSQNDLSLEDCLASLPKDVPLSIVFSGKGIVCKKVQGSDAGLDAAIASVVPNAQVADFAYDTAASAGQLTVALVRKSRCEAILEALLAARVYPIGVGLEFMPLLRFKELLGLEMDTFTVGGYQLKWNKAQELSEFTASAEVGDILKIGDMRIIGASTLAYASAFVALLNPQELHTANFSQAQVPHAEFLEKKLFKFSFVASLVAVLLILIVNTLAFTSQFSKNESLKQDSYRFEGKTEDIKKEEISLLEKENFLKQNGWMHKSKLSFMCDKLAATVPGSIILQDFSINPLHIDNSQAVKKSNFLDKKLILKGKCLKSSDLSNWIQILKHLNWISDVQMVDYTHDHAHNSAIFNIEITYNIE